MVPGTIPFTTPDEFIVATDVLLLVHEPPAVPSESVFVLPVQIVFVPIIGLMLMLITLTAKVATDVKQLLDTVYEIVSIPAATPVTMPVLLTVARAVNSLLHVPPLTASDRVITDPTVTLEGPDIEYIAGLAVTVATTVTLHPDETA